MSVEQHERLQRIFTQACALEHAARPSYLDDACNGDAGLRHEVEALLAEDTRTVGPVDRDGAKFLAGVLVESGDIDARAATSAEASHPERIGRYRILRVISAGGMGIVYEAEQDDPKRRVALKVVRSAVVTPSLLRRFRHETQVLGHLRHPGIAQIYEAGTADAGEGGQPFFAMEYVDGEALTSYANVHDLDVTARLGLIAQLCDIVQHAHQKGIIHRDLKPANIMVTSEALTTSTTRLSSSRAVPGPALKVLDFGVARATDSDLQTVTLQTALGELVGTVPYMSPEQASGDSSAIDVRSDIYAIGVIAYELLAGRLPYDVRGKLVHEAVRVIREDEPSSLSSVDRVLRGDIETIIAKALEKDQARRYQSPADLAGDIRRHLAHEPIEARPPSAIYQLRKFTRRNKTLVGGAVATLAVAVVGAIVATTFALQAARHASALERKSYILGIAAAAAAVEKGDLDIAATYLDDVPPAQLGWEYDYLRARLVQHVDEWAMDGSAASGRRGGALAFDSSGRRMFMVMMDRSIAVRDTGTGRVIRTITFDSVAEQHWRVILNGPARRFAVSAPGGMIGIHDLETGTRIGTIPGGARPLAWTADAKSMLFHGTGRDLRLWDGRDVRVLAHGAGCVDATFDPSGKRVAVVGEAGDIVMLAADSGAILERGEPLGEPMMLAFSPDGALLAALGLYGNDFVLDARTLAVVTPIRGHQAAVHGAAWDSRGRRLVTVSLDGRLQAWDRSTRQSFSYAVGVANPSTLAVTPDDQTVMVAGKSLRSFPLHDPAVLRGHESYVYVVRFSPDGRLLASAGFADLEIHLWDVATRRSVRRLPAPEQNLAYAEAPRIGFTLDGRRFVACQKTEVRQWDLETYDRLPVATDSDDPFHDTLGWGPPIDDSALAMSPDGEVLACARGDTVDLYDFDACWPGDERSYPAPLDGAIPRGTLVGHDGTVHCMAFAPDGSRLATGGADGSVRIWDARTYEQLLVLSGHEDYVKDIAFSPDGTLLASASGDKTVRLWDTVPLHERRAMAGE